MLRIIPASEPMRVDTIVLVVYAPPGTGKTSLAFSANSPLLIDTDNGAYRSAFRKDCVVPKCWADIADINATDVKGYKTLILDTSGRALDLLALDIIANNPKMGRGGSLTLQGYGELKSRFTGYLSLMRGFGLDVVLIAHSDEKQQGDDMIERIDMQGGSKNEVYKSADSMARLGIIGGKRILNFSPTETRFGKDPANIGATEVPHLATSPTFLGDLIQNIKNKLNAENAAQVEAKKEQATFAESLSAAGTASEFTALLPNAKTNTQKKALLAAATANGCTFDGDAKVFVGPVAGEQDESGDLWPNEEAEALAS